MPFLKPVSIAPAGLDWLASSHYPRILHVFDRACNLTNERRQVLSIVTRQIGNGPFNIVVENDVAFSDHLDARSPIFIGAGHITLGDLIVHTDNAQPWSPRPDWEALHARQDDILTQLALLPPADYRPLLPGALISELCCAIAEADIPAACAAARRLAGLGNGLTPAGDDFILGALLAAWIIHLPDAAGILAGQVTGAAAPLTTTLSAAWLESAGRGEAGILWHDFLAALISANQEAVREAADSLLALGHTSGADALAGFAGVFGCRAGRANSETLLTSPAERTCG